MLWAAIYFSVVYKSSQNSKRVCRVRRKSSGTGTRTRVFRVRAEHPNQLDYAGDTGISWERVALYQRKLFARRIGSDKFV